jgi:hypothetical protein
MPAFTLFGSTHRTQEIPEDCFIVPTVRAIYSAQTFIFTDDPEDMVDFSFTVYKPPLGVDLPAYFRIGDEGPNVVPKGEISYRCLAVEAYNWRLAHLDPEQEIVYRLRHIVTSSVKMWSDPDEEEPDPIFTAVNPVADRVQSIKKRIIPISELLGEFLLMF